MPRSQDIWSTATRLRIFSRKMQFELKWGDLICSNTTIFQHPLIKLLHIHLGIHIQVFFTAHCLHQSFRSAQSSFKTSYIYCCKSCHSPLIPLRTPPVHRNLHIKILRQSFWWASLIISSTTSMSLEIRFSPLCSRYAVWRIGSCAFDSLLDFKFA